MFGGFPPLHRSEWMGLIFNLSSLEVWAQICKPVLANQMLLPETLNLEWVKQISWNGWEFICALGGSTGHPAFSENSRHVPIMHPLAWFRLWIPPEFWAWPSWRFCDLPQDPLDKLLFCLNQSEFLLLAIKNAYPHTHYFFISILFSLTTASL